MKGITYYKKDGFSINEGGLPANITMLWGRDWCYLFMYVYFYGRRMSFCIPRKVSNG